MTRDIAPRVIAQQWVSVDGFAAGPNGEQDVFAGVEDFGPSEEHNQRALDEVEYVLLGRRTYESFSAVWPSADNPIAERVNTVPKMVFSTSLSSAPWGGFAPAQIETDPVDWIRRWRKDARGSALVWGSLNLMHSLLEVDEVDELDLFIAPIVLGEGTSCGER